MVEIRRFFLAVIAASLSGCSGATSSPPAPAALLTLAQSVAYLGVGNDACTQVGIAYCLRTPAFGFDVALKQDGNPANFTASSSDPAIVTAAVVMDGPAGQGLPAIRLGPHKAGTAIITVNGVQGATATLPVTVTTDSRFTLTLSGLPAAAAIDFTLMAPADLACTRFAAGYSLRAQAPTPPARSITYGDFPTMGNGTSASCLFSTMSITVYDLSGVALAQKTVSVPIVLGKDNPTAITVP